MISAECVFDSKDHLGEGVLWDQQEQALYWLDVPMPSKLHRWYPDSGNYDSWDRSDGTISLESQCSLQEPSQSLFSFSWESGWRPLVGRISFSWNEVVDSLAFRGLARLPSPLRN